MDAKSKFSSGVESRKEEAQKDPDLNTIIENGEFRKNKYESNWQEVDLDEIVNKFAPGAQPEFHDGKIYFTSADGHYSVITDVGGGYLRIQDNSVNNKKPLYLNLDGTDGHNYKDENGKVHGKSKSMYQQTTHFKIKKRRK